MLHAWHTVAVTLGGREETVAGNVLRFLCLPFFVNATWCLDWSGQEVGATSQVQESRW